MRSFVILPLLFLAVSQLGCQERTPAAQRQDLLFAHADMMEYVMLARYYAAEVQSIWEGAIQDSLSAADIAEVFRRSAKPADSLFAGFAEKTRSSLRRYKPTAQELIPAYMVLEEMEIQRVALVTLAREPQGSYLEYCDDLGRIQARLQELEGEWRSRMGL
jgi:hypothetical protein